MVRYARRARLPRVYEAITRNDDFTDRRTDVRRLAGKRARPLAIFIQEGKRTDYRREVPAGYGVAQVRRTAATAGVAVIYDRRQVQAVGKVRHRVLARGRGLLPRGVTWVPVKLDGVWVTLASTHRPPQRNRADWPEFDRNLRRWLRRRGNPVVLGMDTNVPGRPRRKRRELKRLARSYGMRVRGRSLDAVFINGRLRFVGRAAKRYRRMRSDHHPVGALFRVKK